MKAFLRMPLVRLVLAAAAAVFLLVVVTCPITGAVTGEDGRIQIGVEGRGSARTSPTTRRKCPKPQFAEHDGIDGDVWFLIAKPFDDPRVGDWLRRLAQNIGIDEIRHSMSVDSESTPTK